MTVLIPHAPQSVGIPSQWSDTIDSGEIALITGNEPAVMTEDLLFAASQTIEALVVVGLDANNRVVPATSTVEASVAGTFTGAGTAADTITIGSTVYTLRAAPTTVANEVKIGATAAETAANLAAAINGGDGAGTLYGSLTLPHPDVNATVAGAVVTVTAKVGGTAGNSIASTDSGTSFSWASTTLLGGTATPVTRAIGINVLKVVTDASGHHKGSPVYRAGCFNPLALTWDASYSTNGEKLAAFRGAPTPTNIILRRPKTATVVLP
jgi:hypothetical protein